MTPHPGAEPATPAEALITAQFAALRLLEAEMLALARLIPGAPPANGVASDPADEAAFENMPV